MITGWTAMVLMKTTGLGLAGLGKKERASGPTLPYHELDSSASQSTPDPAHHLAIRHSNLHVPDRPSSSATTHASADGNPVFPGLDSASTPDLRRRRRWLPREIVRLSDIQQETALR